jgi:2-polyprenyl-3-methyl-5-hydroxy-6-metoxy-1,4-benzoquinol methylase
MVIRTSDLDSWINEVDSRGGIRSEESIDLRANFLLEFNTHVNTNLHPFSDEYFNQMLSLYKEISAKDVNQYSNEHTQFSFEQSLNGPNPYGSGDIRFVSQHVHAASRIIKMLDLPAEAELCDLGSGWGLTSEVFSFCGAKVTAVDINKDFVELNNQRFKKFGYNSIAIHSSFDDIDIDKKFDALVFYECLHHAIKPWETIANVKKLLKNNGGKIAIAGEPINTNWWPHWGLRLDAESIYVMRKFGWFESGWSKEFIIECFNMNGLNTICYDNLSSDPGDIVIIAVQE